MACISLIGLSFVASVVYLALAGSAGESGASTSPLHDDGRDSLRGIEGDGHEGTAADAAALAARITALSEVGLILTPRNHLVATHTLERRSPVTQDRPLTLERLCVELPLVCHSLVARGHHRLVFLLYKWQPVSHHHYA